eukprot:9469162-Pyramimonas_sp.AAC.1
MTPWASEAPSARPSATRDIWANSGPSSGPWTLATSPSGTTRLAAIGPPDRRADGPPRKALGE